MGLGKITRTGGKVVAAIELSRLAWLAFYKLYRAVRRKEIADEIPDANERLNALLGKDKPK